MCSSFFFLWSALLVRDLFIQQENNERKDFKAKNEEKKKIFISLMLFQEYR